jgi:tryptophan 2,3-dioxygenase
MHHQLLKDASVICSAHDSLDKMVDLSEKDLHNYVNQRSPIVLAAFRGLRRDPTAKWTYSEGLALESVYHVAAVSSHVISKCNQARTE